MNATNYALNWSAASDLQHAVEPLVNYICAAEQPKSALLSALAVLCREVDATNRAALAHFDTIRNRL